MLCFFLSAIGDENDRSKFEQVYNTYRQLMFYVANGILRDEYLAEDAVHHAFVKILEHLDAVGAVDCPQTKSYVVIIVRNTCFNMLKARKRRDALSLDELEEAAPAADDYCLEQEAEQADGYQRLVAEIRRLPQHYAAVLLLKYDNGYSTEEIARMLDLSAENVKKLLQRARKKLEQRLEEKEEEFA